MLPLTSGPAGVQAWKIILPVSQVPSVRRHDGYEWLYVLTGRMRLLLGEQDLELGVGEAIEFDTGIPHWFGSAGDRPAEMLSLFGRPGERMHVRAQASEQGTAGGGHTDRRGPTSTPDVTGYIDGMDNSPAGKYAVTLEDLERTAHIPADQQVTEQAEPPASAPIAAEELDRQRLLGITSTGRLRQP